MKSVPNQVKLLRKHIEDLFLESKQLIAFKHSSNFLRNTSRTTSVEDMLNGYIRNLSHEDISI
jgi:hypothetical protein